MKFQESSLNGLEVRVGTKKCDPRTHDAPTHAPKAICPTNFFKVGGIIITNANCSFTCITHISEKISRCD